MRAPDSSSRHTDVTVVVTNYNYGQYLEEAVTSALVQDGGAPNIIVVDDGSTERLSAAVLDRLPAEVMVMRQRNGGPSAARNAGLSRACTPFLIPLDADDRLRRGALDALRAPLDAQSSLGFTYGITHFFGDWEGEMTMPAFDPYKLLYRHTIGTTCLLRRELFEQVGGFDPEFPGFEDWEFWLRAVSGGWRGLRVNEVTFDYRRHGTTRLSRDRLEYRKLYRLLRERHALLYSQRRQLAKESGIGPFDRLLYRWWWGPRPLPARIEQAMHQVLWGNVHWRSPQA